MYGDPVDSTRELEKERVMGPSLRSKAGNKFKCERVMGPILVMGRVAVEHDYRDDHVRSTFVVGHVSDGDRFDLPIEYFLCADRLGLRCRSAARLRCCSAAIVFGFTSSMFFDVITKMILR